MLSNCLHVLNAIITYQDTSAIELCAIKLKSASSLGGSHEFDRSVVNAMLHPAKSEEALLVEVVRRNTDAGTRPNHDATNSTTRLEQCRDLLFGHCRAQLRTDCASATSPIVDTCRAYIADVNKGPIGLRLPGSLDFCLFLCHTELLLVANVHLSTAAGFSLALVELMD